MYFFGRYLSVKWIHIFRFSSNTISVLLHHNFDSILSYESRFTNNISIHQALLNAYITKGGFTAKIFIVLLTTTELDEDYDSPPNSTINIGVVCRVRPSWTAPHSSRFQSHGSNGAEQDGPLGSIAGTS